MPKRGKKRGKNPNHISPSRLRWLEKNGKIKAKK